jgi:2',3'-cyclic-nucleotide 2'-phosphodiesterase (5'-nucleotidase family)
METNLGNLMADAIRADVDADIALLNGGGIRSDKVYQPGALSRRNLVEMHPFGNVVCKIALSGRVVLEALNAGVSGLPTASGRFPQVSGLTYRVEVSAPTGSRVRDVTVGGDPLDLDHEYTVALPDYILEGGDGYTMFAGAKRIVSPETGHLVVTALEQYLSARGDVAPAVQGRITIGQ